MCQTGHTPHLTIRGPLHQHDTPGTAKIRRRLLPGARRLPDVSAYVRLDVPRRTGSECIFDEELRCITAKFRKVTSSFIGTLLLYENKAAISPQKPRGQVATITGRENWG
jgi:hypothetical protein